MDFNKYKIFLEVVECRSITKAAMHLKYSQPAVTRIINKLEDEMGIQLLERSRAATVLTSDGEKMLPHFEKLAKLELEMQNTLNEIKNITAGTVVLGSMTGITMQYLPHILEEFEKAYPSIKVKVINGTWTERELRDGELDCGFILKPSLHQVYDRPFLKEKMYAIMSKQHKFVGKKKLSPDDLVKETFIVPKNSVARDINRLCDLIKKPVKKISASDDLVALCMVLKNEGITFFSQSLLDAAQNDNIVAIPVEGFCRTLALGYSMKKTVSKPAKIFIDFCCAEIMRMRKPCVK